MWYCVPARQELWQKWHKELQITFSTIMFFKEDKIMNIPEVTKWRPCPSLKYFKQEWPNHNLTVYKLNLATERVKNKGQNVGNIKQPTFFSLSLRKIQLQHLDKTLASKSWQNFSIKFGPKFSKLFGLARSCKERQGGVSWLLERLRESSHARVTSVKSQQH